VINKFISGCLDLLEESTDVSVERIKGIRSYIEYLEKDNAELGDFFDKINKAVREYTYGDDE
jgi:hypothetical protein